MSNSRVTVLLLLAVGALVLAGCGSGAKPAATADSTGFASFLKFSECMRSSGVTSFPDPNPNGHGINIKFGSGLNPQSPAFQSAQRSCKHLLPGGGPQTQVPEGTKVQMLSHAECMRAHGVSSYPDPTFPKGGGVESFIPPSVEANSPVFQRAAKACGGA